MDSFFYGKILLPQLLFRRELIMFYDLNKEMWYCVRRFWTDKEPRQHSLEIVHV